MTTRTLEIALEDPGGREYPNCYAAIPPNGKVCPHTGLTPRASRSCGPGGSASLFSSFLIMGQEFGEILG